MQEVSYLLRPTESRLGLGLGLTFAMRINYMSVKVWLAVVRKCSVFVVSLDLVLRLYMMRRCS